MPEEAIEVLEEYTVRYVKKANVSWWCRDVSIVMRCHNERYQMIIPTPRWMKV